MMDQSTIDNLSAQRFVHYLVTPFNQWDAYRIGLIDGDGKLKRQPQNQNETKYYNMFHILVTRIKDLLKTSGRGTNWVLPSTAGNFYLGNKNLPATNFTNWSVSNRSSLPIFGAAYSAMRECIECDDDSLFEDVMMYYIDNLAESDLNTVAVALYEEGAGVGPAPGNCASQVVNYQAPIGAGKQGQILNKYTRANRRKSTSEIIKNIKGALSG